VSEDTTATAGPGDAGGRGERRRALQAERERQARRQRPDEPPPPALVRPDAVTRHGQEAAVLVADAPGTAEADAPGARLAPDRAGPLPARADAGAEPHAPDAEPPTLLASDAGAAAPLAADDDPPTLLASDADAAAGIAADADGAEALAADADVPAPPAPPSPVAPAAVAEPPGAQPSAWSAFTPVVEPEPLRFDDTPTAVWRPPEPWTAPVATPPSRLGMPAEPDAALSASEAPDEETAWTVPTPQDGVPLDPSAPQEPVVERPIEPAADLPSSADLSRVGLFRSALEDLAQTPGEGSARQNEDLFSTGPAPDALPRDSRFDDPRGTDQPVGELPADELPAHELAAGEPPADEPPADELSVPPPADKFPAEELRSSEPLSDEHGDEELAADELPTDELRARELPADEPWDDDLHADQLPVDELSSRKELTDEELTDEELTDEKHSEPPTDGDSDGQDPSAGPLLTEPLAERVRPGPPDEAPDEEPRARDLAPAGPAPAPLTAAPPLAPVHPDEVDASLPPLGRPAFGRAPTQRLAEALAHGEEPHAADDDEPVRGTVGPVVRRGTDRVRYPTSTMPVIRPPVMPPTPGSGISIAPVRPGTVSWQQALAGDVLPNGKRKPRRSARVSKPRHVSGGVGEYRPKVAADRSLTLLVVAMLLVLLGLVAVAVWTFWPHISGAPGSLPVLGAHRAVGGP
jgi:hypothetical protein